MRLMRSAAIVVIVAVAVVASSAPSAAITLMTIRGVVTDAVGRPLSGARVTDGYQYVTTDSAGRYELPEEEISSQLVVVTKPGLDPASLLVTPLDALGSVDFTMMYSIGSDTSPRAFNNSPPKTLVVTARSYAPPDSCMTWTDGSTGAQVLLTLETGVAGGQSTWTGSYAVPTGTSDASYSHSAVARDCSSSTALTRVAGGAYIVDSVAPAIDRLGILPADFGNTIFLSQPLIAPVTDDRSGIDPGAFVFTLHDETTGTSATFTGSQVSYSLGSGSGIAKTSPSTLVASHVYRIEVSATDKAGNAMTVAQLPAAERGGFLATAATAGTTLARIPPTSCAVSDSIDPLTQTRAVTCVEVPLQLDSSSVTVAGSRHGFDIGFVDHTTSLQSAIFETTLPGGIPLTSSAYNPADPTWAPKVVPLSFEVPDAMALPADLSGAGRTANLGTLKATVPAAWTEASLRMDPVTTTAGWYACPDPSAGNAPPGCLPDPLLNRFRVELKAGTQSVLDVAAEQLPPHEGRLDADYRDVGTQRWYEASIPPRAVSAIALDPRTATISRIESVQLEVERALAAFVAQSNADLCPLVNTGPVTLSGPNVVCYGQSYDLGNPTREIRTGSRVPGDTYGCSFSAGHQAAQDVVQIEVVYDPDTCRSIVEIGTPLSDPYSSFGTSPGEVSLNLSESAAPSGISAAAATQRKWAYTWSWFDEPARWAFGCDVEDDCFLPPVNTNYAYIDTVPDGTTCVGTPGQPGHYELELTYLESTGWFVSSSTSELPPAEFTCPRDQLKVESEVHFQNRKFCAEILGFPSSIFGGAFATHTYYEPNAVDIHADGSHHHSSEDQLRKRGSCSQLLASGWKSSHGNGSNRRFPSP